jgi:hypothetical protein
MSGAILSSFAGGLRILELTFFCLLATSSPAFAAPSAEPPPSETIAITKMSFAGLASEVGADMQELLRATLRRAGFNILAATVVDNRLANEARLLGCTTPSCYGRLAQVLGVRRVIEVEVQRLALSTFAMKLGLRDLLTGKLVAPQVQERCDVCSNEDARQMVERAANTLTQMAPPTGPQEPDRPPTSGMLVLETDPPGARVTIDKQIRNERTPASLLLGSGVHEVVVEGPGYRALRRTVELPAGQQVPLYLVLTPLPQRRPWLTALAWTSAATAVGLVVAGGLLLHYNGQPVITPTCPDQPGVMFRCPEKYDLLAGGISAMVGAGVLLAGAGVAFYFDNAAPRRRPIVSP